VLAGVLWAIGILYLLDYKISILTALVAPLVVVIGIPNCIYFLNSSHWFRCFLLYAKSNTQRIWFSGRGEYSGSFLYFIICNSFFI
jgi:hypothetical protein